MGGESVNPFPNHKADTGGCFLERKHNEANAANSLLVLMEDTQNNARRFLPGQPGKPSRPGEGAALTCSGRSLAQMSFPSGGSTCCSLESCPACDIVGSVLALTAWFTAQRGSCTPRAGWALTTLPYKGCGDQRWKAGGSAWHCYKHHSLGREAPFFLCSEALGTYLLLQRN